jgi:hypothetical protein
MQITFEKDQAAHFHDRTEYLFHALHQDAFHATDLKGSSQRFVNQAALPVVGFANQGPSRTFARKFFIPVVPKVLHEIA